MKHSIGGPIFRPSMTWNATAGYIAKMKSLRTQMTHLVQKRTLTVALLALLMVAPAAWAAKRDLRVYFIDVEGGQSTLFVTPTGQSLLVDTGWPGTDGRDADRILAATKNAGISKI